MTTKEATYQYRLTQWGELTKERGELGLSIRAYCAMKGFAENTYFYWQRRLRNAATEKVAKQDPRNETLVPGGWTAIVESKAEPYKSVTIEIGIYKISVASGADMELLLKVCRALKELC